MDALTAAASTAAAVSTIGGHFMLDGNTYKRGAELGFQGIDFYVTGRGGVLGDVDADAPLEALSVKSPHMVGLFGWSAPVDTEGLLPTWEAAEEQTTRSIAHAYETLDDRSRAELAELANALHVVTKS